jgi:type I restriction enzyme S subunit
LQAKGKGSAQANINLATFENELFPFPSLKKQKQIVFELENLSAKIVKLEKIFNKKLAYLEDLKKSILQKAFSGDLIRRAS